MALGRVEGRIVVPTGGWTLSINDSGGGGAATATLAAGTYYWSSADENGGGTLSFLAAVSAALNTAASTDTIAVSLSAGELGTGRLTIQSSGSTTIAWVSTAWRDVMGFDVDLAAGTSWTSPNQVRSLWLPGCEYNAPNGIDANWRGWREADFRGAENSAGYVWAHMGQEKVVTWLRWEAVRQAKVWTANESIVNASWERFCRDAIWGVAAWGTPGGPIRFHPSAADDTLFATYKIPDFGRIQPEQVAASWAGGPWVIEIPRMVAVPDTESEGLGGGGELPPVIVVSNVPPMAGFSYAVTTASATYRQFPDSASEWASIYSGITTPSHIWTFQEASGNVLNKVGSGDMVPNVTLAYRQSGETEPTNVPRYGIQTVNTNVSERVDCSVTTVGNAGTADMTLGLRFKIPDNGATDRSIFGKGTGNGSIRGYVEGTTGKVCFLLTTAEGAVTVKTASAYDDGAYHDIWFVIDQGSNLAHIITATEDVTGNIAALTSAFTHASALRLLCSSGTTALAGTALSYAMLWSSSARTAANLATFVAASAGATGVGVEMAIAVPAYFYATSGTKWATMTAEAPTAKIAVLNPGSGPGAGTDSNYDTVLLAFQAAGGYGVGYITTNYRDRFGTQSDGISRTYANIANVKAQIDDWYTFYPTIDGIFLDEMSNQGSLTDIAYYSELYSYIKTKGGTELVIENPGANFPESMAGVADIFMRFEGTYASYSVYTPPTWQANYDKGKWWDCVHTCTSAQRATALARARVNNAGYVYLTDDVMANPYDNLPTYWTTLVSDVEAANEVASAGYDVTFTDTSTDTDGTIASWTWNFGDGSTSTLQHPVHTYASPGTYSVTLTVTDNLGTTNAKTTSVVVA